jgi:hypothetical protein
VAVVVKMAVVAEVVETVLVTITVAALTVKMVVAVETVVVMIMAAAVYRRRRWFVSSVSDVRIMCNITSLGYLNNDRPWSSV